MKRLLSVLMITIAMTSAMAQPTVRRSEAAARNAQSTSGQMTQRAQIMYPTAVEMPEDVVWRRDIYRELDLMEEANAGLYYPVEPVDRQLNLFTYVFKLALNGYIPIYEYRLDGNEVFTDSAKVMMQTVLDNYHIYYEDRQGRIHVDNSDIPSAEVTRYYLKESAYYDQANSSFRRKVVAFCPVMVREDDFGGEPSKYPLFWIKYSDVEPYLSRQEVMTSNLNNAATMTLEDFFELNRYKGSIYKTNNLLGRTLAQYCTTDSAMAKEQQRIEDELALFEKKIFGEPERKDSLDSIAKNNPKAIKEAAKAAKKRDRRSRSTSASSTTTVSSGSSAPRVTVRRERH